MEKLIAVLFGIDILVTLGLLFGLVLPAAGCTIVPSDMTGCATACKLAGGRMVKVSHDECSCDYSTQDGGK